MKKKVIIIIFYCTVFTFFILSHDSISASTNQENCTSFTNNQGVYISEDDCERLLTLGYSNEYLHDMPLEEFELNKDLHGEIISSEIKYYKTTYHYDNNDNSIYLLNTQFSNPTSSITEELTESEFNKQLFYENKIENILSGSPFTTLSTGTGSNSTTYKSMLVQVVKLSNGKYRVYTTLDWKKMPRTRERDVIGAGIRHPDYFVVNHTK